MTTIERLTWDECGNSQWMTWLVGRAHRHGRLDRKRLVACALRWIEPIAHLLPDDSVLDLGVVAAWVVGASTDAAAAAAAYRAAAAATTAATTAAADAAAAGLAFCDIVRASITVDEVCAALDIDPDAPTLRAAA